MLHKNKVDQKEIIFMWTCFIRGNEAAERAAKEGLDQKPTYDLMPFSDLKPLTAKYIHQIRQEQWDEAVKIHEILPKLSDKLIIL